MCSSDLRSLNGTEWTSIQFVKGNGTTANASEYTAVDKTPLKGANLYRLNQVDMDNKHTYSQTVAVKFGESNGLGFSYFPNPAKSNLRVNIESIENAVASLNLLNADGKMLKSLSLSKMQSNSTVNMDIATLAPGVYYLQ